MQRLAIIHSSIYVQCSGDFVSGFSLSGSGWLLCHSLSLSLADSLMAWVLTGLLRPLSLSALQCRSWIQCITRNYSSSSLSLHTFNSSAIASAECQCSFRETTLRLQFCCRISTLWKMCLVCRVFLATTLCSSARGEDREEAAVVMIKVIIPQTDIRW